MEDKIITVASYPYSRAILLKGRLEAEGIECFLSNINLVQPQISSGVKIRINEKDADKAVRIIEEIKEEYGTSKQKTVDKLKSIRRILIPVDFSDASVNACELAVGLALKLKAEIKLLYSYFNPILISEPYLEDASYYHQMDEVIKSVGAEAKQKMLELIAAIRQKAEKNNHVRIKITYILDRGAPEDIIIKVAESWDPAVIIMGTKGMELGSVDYLGSITRKILKKAKMPVLIIPQRIACKSIEYIGRVLYATDFDETDFRAIRILLTLLSPFNVRLYCVHITSGKESAFDRVKMERLKEHISAEYNDYQLHCDLIRRDNLMDGLEEYIEEKDIDLMALTTHKRGIIERLFNPSLTKQMLFHTSIPLLVFQS